MIARTWRGVVPSEKAEAYSEYLHETGVPGIRGTPGNRGCYVMRRTDGDRAHFLMISFWDSYEAIKAFAGDDIDHARYYPEDADFLVELEPKVKHYDVLTSPDDMGA